MLWISIFTLYLCIVCRGFQYLRYICVLYVVDFNIYAIIVFCLSWISYLRYICVFYVVGFNIYALFVCCMSLISIFTR